MSLSLIFGLLFFAISMTKLVNPVPYAPLSLFYSPWNATYSLVIDRSSSRSNRSSSTSPSSGSNCDSLALICQSQLPGSLSLSCLLHVSWVQSWLSLIQDCAIENFWECSSFCFVTFQTAMSRALCDCVKGRLDGISTSLIQKYTCVGMLWCGVVMA